MLVRKSWFSSSTRRCFLTLPNFTFHRLFSDSSIEQSVSQPFPIFEGFISLFENCFDITLLRKLHTRIIAFGLENHILLGSKLLICYANLGKLTESRWVFDKIINWNPSLWNTIFVGYFRAGEFYEVQRLYLNSKRQSVSIYSTALTFSLKSCTETGNIEFGRGVHVDALKVGLNADGFVGSSLIVLYSKCGYIEDAQKVFDEISDKDVVTCTSMVTGYANLSDNRAIEAFRIVGYMQEAGLDPNRVTLVSLLQVATLLEELREGKAVHGYAIRKQIDSSNDVFETSLIDMYIKCGCSSAATSLFSRIGIASVACWNALIAGHVQIGCSLEALDFFIRMMQENVVPDVITLSNVLLGSADLKSLLSGKSIHGYIIRSGVCLDVVAKTALIDMYCACNSIKQARTLFDATEFRDVIMLNVMIAGYVGNRLPDKAIESFCGMVEEGIKPNIATILSILSACARMENLREGKSIHGYILRWGLELNTEIANNVLYMYGSCGRIDIAREIFKRLTSKDLVSWTLMMMGYVHHGHANESINFFRLMQEEQLKPDAVTIVSLLQGVSQLGYLKPAQEVHCYVYRFHLEKEIPVLNSLATTYSKCGRLDMSESLFEHTTRRSLTSWNVMLAAYRVHGKCVEALETFNRMLLEKVDPDELTFTSLISACSHAGLVEEGLHVFRLMTTKHSMVPCEEHYGCLVDLLGRAGQLQETYDIVKCLPPPTSASALAALLAACKVHRNMEMGEVAKQLLDLEPESSGAYTLLSNLYASEASEWDVVYRLREIVKERGLSRQPGYSSVSLDNQATCLLRRSAPYIREA